MIFEKLFKPKWQHKDANVRIQALNEFDVNNPELQTILEQLAEQDSSELVRRSALIKINSPQAWFKAMLHNSNRAIVKFAQSKFHALILETDKVGIEQKLAYLPNCPRSTFTEQWLMIEHNTQVLQGLIDKVNKPNILAQLLLKTDNEDLQIQLLSDMNELDLLEKLCKKAVGKPVFSKLDRKVKTMREAIEKPIKLHKQIQLSLSKLLALKDVQSYEDMLNRKAVIEQEWQAYLTDFDCLPLDEQAQLKEKYEHILSQLKKHFIVLEEAYQQQKIIIERELKEQQQSQQFNQQINHISKHITEAVFDNAELDQGAVSDQLTALNAQIAESILTDAHKNELKNKTKALEFKLTKLPEVAQSVSAATALIAKFSGLSVPTNIDEYNQRKPLFSDWNSQWKQINALANDILPESLTKARDELHQIWAKAIAEFEEKQNKAFHHFRKKMSELRRLISYGKYKAAFGLHTKLTYLHAEFAEDYQQRLSKDFEWLNDKIKELHELESFVVTPKKQSLLNDILALVENPFDNPQQQADQVKRYRKQWNLLGHADEAMDKELNSQFNKACEEAFAPCRQYYAEQGKIREQHLEDKQQVLKDIESLAASINDGDENQAVDWQNIDAQLSKLMSKWRETGEIDRDKYQVMHKQYRKLVDPIKKGVHNFQDANVELKQALIEQAKQHGQDEDVFAAINALKALQHKWRSIGYAGPQKENQLWQAFRKVNDQLFAKRDSLVEAQKDEKNAEFEALQTTFAQLQTRATDVELSGISALITDIEQFINEIRDLKSSGKSLVNNANTLMKNLHARVAKHKENKQAQALEAMFALITELSQTEQTVSELKERAEFKVLNKPTQKAILSALNCDMDKSIRERLTIELEILAEIDSPQQDLALRRQIQVELLADKLNQGEVNLQQKFDQWLRCAAFVGTKVSVIERTQKALMKAQ